MSNRERAKKIKMIIMDVDGTLTDGKLTLLPDGEELKSYNVRDGLGILLARLAGLKTGIITGKTSKPLEIRAEKLKRGLQTELRPYDVIVSKAVSKLDRFLDQAIPLLRRPGIMIAMKGRSVEAELEAAGSKIGVEGLVLTVKKYRLPHLDIERCLIILSNSPDALKASQSLP